MHIYRQPPWANPLATKKVLTSAVFAGGRGRTVTTFILPTPGGREKCAVVVLSRGAAREIAELNVHGLFLGSYEACPELFECRAYRAIDEAAPELITAIRYAQQQGAALISVVGLPQTVSESPTPLDGVVVEDSVRTQVFYLTGCLTASLGLGGFAYKSENNGQLLRAVSPVRSEGSKGSSQGFAVDLTWHSDNANRLMADELGGDVDDRGPVNENQAFVTVKPDSDAPMEIVALADVLEETLIRYGISVVKQLERPNYAVRKPDSDHGGVDIEGVPLLIHGGGLLHGRFHGSNIRGLTSEAQQALEIFRSVIINTNSKITVNGAPGSLLMYSNTRVLHRRAKFAPKLNGDDRYYIRLYTMGLSKLSKYGRSRVLP